MNEIDSDNDTNNYTVLIVDDVPQNLQVIGNILREQQIHSYAALNGGQALNILSDTKIDLVLLDISMPEMDGYEVCQRIRHNQSLQDLPVIFLTARSQTDDIIKGFEYGGVDYITKPFNSNELLQRVRTHLKLKRAQEIIRKQNEILAEHQQQLEIQNQQLQEANATKDKFFSIIAHDLKGPFNALLNLSELLVNNHAKYSEEKRESFLKMIHDSASRTFTLLENLLIWSRSQTNRISFNPEKINLYPLVQDIILLQNYHATEEKGVRLNNYLTEKELWAFADYEMVYTVLRNLISNAIKFTPTDGEVNIGTQPMQEQEKIILYVADTGMGIAEKNQQKLFKLDESYSTEGTNKERGTGLGLILCKEFVEKNAGTLWLESEEGKGSTFYFSLPVAKV